LEKLIEIVNKFRGVVVAKLQALTSK